ITLQLSNHGTSMEVIDAGQAHPFGNHAEGNAMRLLPRVCSMTGTVQVQDQAVLAGPFSHGLDGGVADGQVDHDDDTTQLLGKLGTLVHVFHGGGSDIHVMALDLTGLSAGLVDCLYTIEEAVTPAHEGLRVDIFIVLHKVQATTEGLIDDTTVVTGGKTEIRLGRSAEQRPAILSEVL